MVQNLWGFSCNLHPDQFISVQCNHCLLSQDHVLKSQRQGTATRATCCHLTRANSKDTRSRRETKRCKQLAQLFSSQLSWLADETIGSLNQLLHPHWSALLVVCLCVISHGHYGCGMKKEKCNFCHYCHLETWGAQMSCRLVEFNTLSRRSSERASDRASEWSIEWVSEWKGISTTCSVISKSFLWMTRDFGAT